MSCEKVPTLRGEKEEDKVREVEAILGGTYGRVQIIQPQLRNFMFSEQNIPHGRVLTAFA